MNSVYIQQFFLSLQDPEVKKKQLLTTQTVFLKFLKRIEIYITNRFRIKKKRRKKTLTLLQEYNFMGSFDCIYIALLLKKLNNVYFA